VISSFRAGHRGAHTAVTITGTKTCPAAILVEMKDAEIRIIGSNKQSLTAALEEMRTTIFCRNAAVDPTTLSTASSQSACSSPFDIAHA
jgi:hypothetical protein